MSASEMVSKAPTPPPKCVECQKTESLLWRSSSGEQKGQICQECYEQKCELEEAEEKAKNAKEKEKLMQSQDVKPANNVEEKRLRKSTRATTRCKSKGSAGAAITQAENGSNATGGGGGGTGGGNKASNKGRNRRNLFKKMPYKTPVAQATTHVVESVFYKGSYMQVGDIVSLVDSQNNVYYAQIRGLLVDNYCEKSAYLTWLIPSQASPDPAVGFDPATYLIGPDEELSRKLSYLEFVMHAPSNYYWDRTTPYPLPDHLERDTKPGGYIWTTLPEYHRKKATS